MKWEFEIIRAAIRTRRQHGSGTARKSFGLRFGGSTSLPRSAATVSFALVPGQRLNWVEPEHATNSGNAQTSGHAIGSITCTDNIATWRTNVQATMAIVPEPSGVMAVIIGALALLRLRYRCSWNQGPNLSRLESFPRSP